MALEIKQLEHTLIARLDKDSIDASSLEQILKAYQNSDYANIILDFSSHSTLGNLSITFLNQLDILAKFDDGLLIAILKNDVTKDFQKEIPDVVLLGTEHEAVEAIMMHELEKQFKAEIGEI
jgi:hypothetical protein